MMVAGLRPHAKRQNQLEYYRFRIHESLLSATGAHLGM
jgi:hypothetical protein